MYDNKEEVTNNDYVIENEELFNKLNDERKKNVILEDNIRTMRKNFKLEVDKIKNEKNELKNEIINMEQYQIKEKNKK